MKERILAVNNILLISTRLLLIVSLISSAVLIGDLWIFNKPLFAEDSKVTISTDKTEYAQGDTATIIVSNGIDSSIWGFNSCGGRPFWGLQKLVEGTWKNLDFSIPLQNKADVECVMVLCERKEPQELKQKLEIKDEWHITFFCDFINGKGVLLDEPKKRIVEKGIYRLILTYTVDKSLANPYDLMNPKRIYSNEFIIK